MTHGSSLWLVSRSPLRIREKIRKERERQKYRTKSLVIDSAIRSHPLGQTRRLRNDSAANQIREFPERRAETSIFRSVIKAVIVNRKERNSEKIKSLPANCGSKRQKANMCVHIYVYIYTHTYTYTRALKRKMQAKAAWAGARSWPPAIILNKERKKKREKTTWARMNKCTREQEHRYQYEKNIRDNTGVIAGLCRVV